jgi:hypothetical protein
VPGVTRHKEDEGDYNLEKKKKRKCDGLLKWSRNPLRYVTTI